MKKTFRTRLTALLICVVFLPSNVYGLGAKAFIAEEYTDSSIADEYEDSAIENEYVDFSMDDYADSSADMSKVNSVGTFEPILEDAVEAIAVSGTSLKDAYVSDSPALPRKLIVKYKDDVSEAMAEVSARKIAREFSIDNPEQISMDGSSRLEVFSFEKAAESELDTESLIMDLQTDPNVEYVQEDFLFTPLSSPGDPDFDMQWGLKNIGQDIDGAGGTAGADINVTDVWDELAPQSGVVVGLLDTGVDIDHPDLQDIVVEGYDFTGPESNILPLDGDPHGTQIAGIIAAKHNLEGIAGAAPNVSIMPLKFIENGAGYTSDALNAIEYAKLNGIRVINCSWGSTFYNRALYEAISDNPHILFVCSAGNIDGGQPIYPAAFGLSNILAVSSADNKGLADINASHGDYVNLYAPGVNIYTAMPDGGYDFVSGTSMSAGFVSAAAAIYLQYYPGALGRDIAAAVRQSVSYRGEDEPVTPIAAGTNAPLLNVGAMLDIPPGAELPASTEYTSSLPDGFDLSEYYTPYGDQIEYIQDLMSSNQLYTDLSDEEIETLNLCLSVTDEAMTECADGGFGIYDAYVKAKIMCYTDSSLADVLTMIDNYGGDEEAAALQAYIFDFYRLKHPELFEADESGGLTALLIGGYTANEIGNAFIFSEVLEIFIEEAINWIDEIRSSAPPEFQYDSSGYDSYLIDKLLWDYGIGQRRIALNAFNVIDVYEAAENLKVYRLTHNMYFDNTVHTYASTTYNWNKYSCLSLSKYVDKLWEPFVSHGVATSSYTGHSTYDLSETLGYIGGPRMKTISRSNPGAIYIINSATKVTFRQILSSGAMYTTTRTATMSTTYIKGAFSYGTVSSTSSTAYPRSGHQGGYWYEYAGATTTSVPTITVDTIANTTVGSTVYVNARSSTPCYRMYASYTVNGGSEVSLGTVYSNVYSKTFQANTSGTYKLTVQSRSYPETDSRTASSSFSRTFTVTQPTRTVSYSGNGNTSGLPPTAQTWTVGNYLTLRTNSGNLAKSGYVFNGWNTSSNGTGVTYNAGGTYNLGSNTLTLYARWTASTVTITWNPDGGSVSPTSSSKTANSTFGTLPTPSKSGYNFDGWYTARNGAGTRIYSTSTVPSTNTTYYAKWIAKTVTITWNANGGSVSPSSAVKNPGSIFVTLPTPTRSGYSFAGWFSSTSFTGSKLISSSIVPASNTTYYAKWEALTVAVTVTLKPSIPDHNGLTGTARAIESLPIQIQTVTANGVVTTVSSGTTNSQGVYSASVTVPQGRTLQAKLTFDNAQLRVQNQSAVTYSLTYAIPISTNGSSATLTVSGSVTGNTLIAFAIWSNALKGLAAYNALSTNAFNKITFRCSQQSDETGSTCYGNSYILLDGSSTDADYLDRSVIFHEMGHWKMNQLWVMPSGASGHHTINGRSNKVLAYTEGWGDYFASALNNSKYYYDFSSNNKVRVGGDFDLAKYMNGNSWDALQLNTSDYLINQEYQLNISTIFWKFKNQFSHSIIQNSLIQPTRSSMQDVYGAAIMNAVTANKEAVWTIFNNRSSAFDLSLPTVTVTKAKNSHIFTVSAYDNVAVKKIEWYVDGIHYETVNNISSDTLNLFQKLLAGRHVVQARVYDPEGLATGSRPRSKRYGEDSMLVDISSTAAATNSAAFNSELFNRNNIPDMSYVSPDERVVLYGQSLITLDGTEMMEFTVSQCEDVFIYVPIWGGASGIKIYNPDGDLHDEVKYIAPDESYLITNATPGAWVIEIVILTSEELNEIMQQSDMGENAIKKLTENSIENQFEIGMEGQNEISIESQNEISEINTFTQTQMELVVSTRPTPIEIERYYDTNDPLLLMEYLENEFGIAVYEDDVAVDITMPLSEGEHQLTVRRENDGQISEEKQVEVRVDTTAPTIYYRNQSLSTQEEGIFLIGVVSEDTVGVKINGEDYHVFGDSNFGIYIPLEIGLTEVQIELEDSAGNYMSEIVGLIRTL